MQFIDSHCHLDVMSEAPGGLDGVLQRMRETNTKAVTIGTQKDDWPLIAEIAAKNPVCVRYTVGLHPQEVKEDWKEHIASLEKVLSETKGKEQMVGIGEIGLDYFRLAEDPHPEDTVKWQRAALEAQLSILKSISLPCVIHSRGPNAFADSVVMIDKAGLDWRKFVYHCFSEGPAEVRELNARGGRASFTGIITFKNGQKMRDALLAQNIELLMAETDAPFLSPEPHRGQVNEPSRVCHVAAKAAELIKMPLEQLAPILVKNTLEFYGLDSWQHSHR